MLASKFPFAMPRDVVTVISFAILFLGGKGFNYLKRDHAQAAIVPDVFKLFDSVWVKIQKN